MKKVKNIVRNYEKKLFKGNYFEYHKRHTISHIHMYIHIIFQKISEKRSRRRI